MCPDCNGLGTKPEMDPTLVVPDPSKSVNEGAIAPYASVIGKSESWTGSLIHNLARTYKIDFDKPWQELSKKHRELLLHGTGGERIAHSVKFATGKIEFERAFEGVLNELYRRFRQTKSEGMRRWYMQYLSETDCSACGGRRLRPESSAVKLDGRSLPEIAASTIEETRSWLRALALDANARHIAEEVLKEIHARLGFLADVGLGYLTLDRPGPRSRAARASASASRARSAAS